VHLGTKYTDSQLHHLLVFYSLGYDTTGDMDFQFHKELIDYIRKMNFSLGSTPLAEQAHKGISPLAFGAMSVAKEN